MSYFRPTIDALSGYTPGEQPQGGDWIKLNTNENPYPPSPHVIESIRNYPFEKLRRYPDPLGRSFCEAAARRLDVDPDCILACNGSDDALTILTRACLDPGDTMVFPMPSYTLYQVLAGIQGAKFETRPFLENGELPDDFLQGAKLGFVPNPNAPTGTFLSPDRLLQLAQESSSLLVADEAYADFAPDNAVSRIAQCERLVVTRTLSKSYSLAGIRFGFLVAQPALIQTFRKVKDSYNCDALSIAAATAAMEDVAYFEKTRDQILATRYRMETELAELGFTVQSSQANFVWIRRSEPMKPLLESLKGRRILVRYFDYPQYGEGLRISVGTDAEIDVLMAALKELV